MVDKCNNFVTRPSTSGIRSTYISHCKHDKYLFPSKISQNLMPSSNEHIIPCRFNRRNIFSRLPSHKQQIQFRTLSSVSQPNRAYIICLKGLSYASGDMISFSADLNCWRDLVCNYSNCSEGRENLRDVDTRGLSDRIVCIDFSSFRGRGELCRVWHLARYNFSSSRLCNRKGGSAKKKIGASRGRMRSQFRVAQIKG